MGQGEPSARPRAAELARTAVRRTGHLLTTSPGGVSVWTALHAVDPTGPVVLAVPPPTRWWPPSARRPRARAPGPGLAWYCSTSGWATRPLSCRSTRPSWSSAIPTGPGSGRSWSAGRPWALEPELRRRAGRLAQARLDRHGLELWAATPEGWERTRLPFELPLASPDQLPGTLQLLLSRAQTCCRERLALRPADD